MKLLALTDITSLLNRVEPLPLLWLGGFFALLALHLVLHPLAGTFRQALRWLGRHPAPVLLFATSMLLADGVAIWRGASPDNIAAPSPIHAWPDIWITCLVAAWQDFALIFHTALIPPVWGVEEYSTAACRALISATSQVWLCCYLVSSWKEQEGEQPVFRRVLTRWRSVFILAACHFPWWWLEGQTELSHQFLRVWLLPEFFVFLAPLPLAIACTSGGFIRAGETALRWWRRAWMLMAGIMVTALPLLALLQYTTRTAAEVLPPEWAPGGLVLKSVMAATVHLWLFVSFALVACPDFLRQPDSSTSVANAESTVEG